MSDHLEEAHAELERLQKDLESRSSVVHFARGAIALLASLIFAGTAGKLFWDSIRFPILGILAAALATCLALYSVRRFVAGKRLSKGEFERFEALKRLRRQLRIDPQPSTDSNR